MKTATLTRASGKVKISEGAVQFQLNKDNAVGITHSLSIPVLGAEHDFMYKGVEIHHSFGNTPCYIEMLDQGEIIVSYEDIS